MAVIYGANYVIAKGLMPDKIQPSGFIVFRVVGALLLFGPLFLMRFEYVQPKDFVRLFFCGLTGVATNQLLFFNGLNATSPVNASIIMTINPILVLIMSAILLKTKVTALKIAGIVIGAIGAIALLILSSNGSSEHAHWSGDVMVLLNATSYALYLVLVKPLMAKYKPTTVIFYAFLMGAVVAVPIGYQQAMLVDWTVFNSADFGALTYVIIATTFLAYLLNIFALKKVNPTVVSVYIYLQPLMAGLCAFAFAMWGLTDYTSDITAASVACALLIFVGVYLVSKPSKNVT